MKESLRWRQSTLSAEAKRQDEILVSLLSRKELFERALVELNKEVQSRKKIAAEAFNASLFGDAPENKKWVTSPNQIAEEYFRGLHPGIRRTTSKCLKSGEHEPYGLSDGVKCTEVRAGLVYTLWVMTGESLVFVEKTVRAHFNHWGVEFNPNRISSMIEKVRAGKIPKSVCDAITKATNEFYYREL